MRLMAVVQLGKLSGFTVLFHPIRITSVGMKKKKNMAREWNDTSLEYVMKLSMHNEEMEF